ncbi:VTT domain-containing protein [Eoetvoesia caeni]|nr:VTT domain-containing protein [Eoetvoesiella caeni]
MDFFFNLVSEHGLWAVFAGVFIEQVGAPIPALPFLLVAGMDAIDNSLYGVMALVVASVASMLADLLWFLAGRRHGRRMLSLLCKIAISPDSCVRQSELSFAKHGVATLVISKFVPGISTLAPPMAGAMGMSTTSFVIFNLAGSVLWAGCGLMLGILFHEQIQNVLIYLDNLGGSALVVIGALLGLYIGFRVWRRLRLSRLKSRLSLVQPAELAQMLENNTPMFLLDVRQGGAEGGLVDRIQGARNIDLGLLAKHASLPEWKDETDVIVYCACPNDASAVKAAYVLRRRGIKARVLNGGMDGWIQSGFALEHIKAERL